MKNLKERPLVSVVVPVYKTPEHFLRNCIQSVLDQTMQNFQLILVDDGSEDQCSVICDEYAQQDERILALHQKNQGPSVARNFGMQHIKGKYFTFLDADDALKPNAWEHLLAVLEKYNTDCIVFGWEDVKADGSIDVHSVTDDYRQVSAADVRYQIASDNYLCGGGYPWNKIWDTDKVLEKCGEIPGFSTELYTYEDKHWILMLMCKLDSMVLIPDVLYRYSFLPTSLTQDEKAWKRRQFNAYEAYEMICDLLKPVDKRAYRGALKFYFHFCYIDMTIIRQNKEHEMQRYQDTITQLCKISHRAQWGDFKDKKYILAWIFYWTLGLFR